MELRHLRYFTAVVQWESYREASRRIHVAQPAISQTVVNLEEELGLKLFSRAKRMAQLTPVHQDAAFEKEEIDIGFTRTLTAEQSTTFSSRVLYRDPLLAVLPRSRPVKSKRVHVADLANEIFVLFHRQGHPSVFDMTIAMCRKAGFSPRVGTQPAMLQTVLSLVEAEQGVSIV